MTPFVPDPRNRDFVFPDRPTDGLTYLSPDQVQQFNEAGYIKLPKALGPEWLQRLMADIDPIEAGIGDTTLNLEGGRSFRYKADAISFARNLVVHSKAVRDLVTSPLFAAIGHDLIGPDLRLYWDQAVYKKPEKARIFPWHQDNGYTFTDPQPYITCWIALNDATRDNGCPWILPGIHRLGTLIHDSTPDGIRLRGADQPQIEDTAICVPAKAGDMVIFSSLTPHKTGANISNGIRKALIIQLMPDGLCFIEEDGKRIVKNDPVLNMLIPAHDKARA
ncbi:MULTISPECIES: phytanoyl-CoA dioxygenase family protein [unclassified Iodidimonas]|jgi:ectoine hydroxylase-related dioxygenase (phytanoyl-CoA dioxygenase family)|uniref:phytanoyl-CoA dioxygenase family protein n=1 Tax=unclassified Iodidimonas TaxID=2626145 RepID=UPI00248273C4|nr:MULTISPECIES: phytanoyl-CoA dioxygenase family protein [unclassified Iodidimonas]